MSIKPKEIKEKDFTQAIQACHNYLNFFESNDYNEDRLAHYENQINEKILEVVFGKVCWDYINEKLI